MKKHLFIKSYRSGIRSFFTKKFIIAKWQFNAFGTVCLVIGTIIGSYAVLQDLVPRIFASDTTYDWTFTTSGDYSVSDSNFIEVSGSSAKLKVQNYTSDANTAALFHFDESSGNPADTSSNSNTATATNFTYAAGKFNNAGSFNGSTSRVSIADSSSLSFVQTHTIEAWTKLNTAMDSNSHVTKQTIVDKGQYQLYYDQETGKVTYELAKSSATDWEQVAGNNLNESWDQTGKVTTTGLTNIGTDVYASLGSATGDAEVWRYRSGSWSRVGGDGLNGSWAANTFEEAMSMATDGTSLFVGLGTGTGDAEVWQYNPTGNSWTKIGGDATGSGGQSWAASTYENVSAMSVAGGNTLIVGLGLTASDAEVWKCTIGACATDSGWTKIGGDASGSGGQSWTTGYEAVYSMAVSGNNLFVGLGLTSADAEVWYCNNYTSCTTTSGWSKLGGDGTGSGGQSWANTYEQVTALEVVSSGIYVGLGNTNNSNDGEVWFCSDFSTCGVTSGWAVVGGSASTNGTTNWATTHEQVWALESDGTNLYAGLGNTAGDNEVWVCTLGSCSTTGWTKIAGDAVNSGFTNTHIRVQSLLYANSTLYIGLTASAASAQIWTAVNSGSWTLTQIAGSYVNNSWGYYGLNTVETMTTANGKLYAGLGTTTDKAMVWEYDGTSWTRIGGQGINSGWAANTYETVTAMVNFNGELVVGLGTGANDAEVWRFIDATDTWEKLGGDSTNNGWTTNYDSVWSLGVMGGKLYAGIGSSAGEAEVWEFNDTTDTWAQIGGTASGNWGTTLFDTVQAMSTYQGVLYIGMGLTAGEAEVWQYSGSGTAWTKVGGDGVNSSWNTNYETVETLTSYNGKLYAGLGNTNAAGLADAEVWEYNGSSWTQVGGDGVNQSWDDLVYERVQTMRVYNGELYAGLAITAGDGEVWKYNGSVWSKVGGDSLNNGWTNVIERVASMAVYKGKLYAGIGDTAAVDAMVYAYGDNGYLQSAISTQDTNWHHIAATYDGATMKIYIDGVENSSSSVSLSMNDGVADLLIGSGYGNNSGNSAGHTFDGYIDEIRISNSARGSFTTQPYSSELQTVKPNAAVLTSGVLSFDAFTVDETLNGGAIIYRLSADGGTTWQYYTGGAWTTSGAISLGNTASEVNDNIDTFPVGSSGIMWQAILDGDGTEQVTLNSVSVGALEDNTVPNPPSSVTALSASSGGTSITTDTWYGHTSPHFSWSGASDTGGSGIEGYYVYFGSDNTADPQTAGNFQAGNSYTAGSLVSGSTYYLRIKAKDRAQNVSTIYSAFTYKLDSSSPTNPSLISVSPAGYSSTNSYTFSWPASGEGAGADVGAGIAGYQYKTGAATGDLSDWSDTIITNSVVIADAAYQEGANTFYLRTIDVAGNVNSGSVQVNYYYSGEGPSAPQFLTATPSSNTTNSFAFSWQPPQSHSGDEDDLTYCYTVNTLPTADNCSFTSAGATSLSADSFATQQGANTFYVTAKNADENGGAINYGNYASVTFTADTSAPGIPGNFELSDISVKSTSSWKVTLSWESPGDIGSGISSYEVFRSSDDTTFTKIASTTGIAYVDTDLEQETTYYKVRACDSVNNCGAFTASDSILPTGKFTEAASLASGPETTLVTTKKATVTWTTDRASDSKVSYGVAPGSYFSEEASNSDQKTAHTINLTNLVPGTTYYYVAKWTDEDGNTGISDEKSFKTEPSPVVTDPKVKIIGLSSVTLEYTISGASKVKIYYGETAAFGAFKEVSTSTSETTYTTTIDDIKDGTKYFYKINTVDSESSEYEGNTLSFETLPRPRVSNVRVQQVKGTAQPTILVGWSTNTEVSSIVTYHPESNSSAAKDQVNVALVKGEHKMIITNLSANTTYTMYIKGRDKAGNETISDPQRVTTATDTRPPLISNLKVEGTAIQAATANGQPTAQLVVSWDTDEPSSSQVEYGEGTGTTYAQKTQEDANLTTNHLVVISGLTPSKVYHVRAGSKDEQNNFGYSVDTVVITPKATESALSLVIGSLQQVFGFLGDFQ